MGKQSAIQQILHYHEQTKHQPNRYAKGPGQMDWANEPIPFRFYEGSKIIKLPFPIKDPDAPHHALYARSQNRPLPFLIGHVASMLELSLGLSAWKSFQGSRWALRMNPSSGNLHPTEAYLILPPKTLQATQGGVFHYSPYSHGLEQRALIDNDLWKEIGDHFGTDVFFLGLSSIHWRESWKYGERAFRYCNHDVGHAIACLSFAANLHGWHVRWLSTLTDRDLATMLGFDKTTWHDHEKEWPDLLLMVHKSMESPQSLSLPSEIIQSFSSLSFEGKPNRLSREHADWNIIDTVAAASETLRTPERSCKFSAHDYLEKAPALPSAATIIRQRRSTQAFDAKTEINRETFYAMLDKTIPRQNCAPFDAGLGYVSVHLAIFVHRVSGLEQGLYLLIRDKKDLRELKSRCRADLLWQNIESAPDILELYLLQKGDFKEIASTVSCFQEIAGDSAFSLGMIAKFREKIEKDPSLYRRLFWETGMIGQVLYLEAEAHGFRGTGIGCFLDDVMHRLLGLTDDSYQDLYHFTVGKPLEDKRITTLPPYHHLEDANETPVA